MVLANGFAAFSCERGVRKCLLNKDWIWVFD
jgi:hypothetical protein